MTSSSDCIFCQIAAGAAPAEVVHQDDDVVAFRDANPIAPVHLLVVPRHHIPSLNEADDPALLGHMLAVARDLARDHGLAQRGYRTLINCQRDGGQVVFHLHLHVIGGRRLGPMG